MSKKLYTITISDEQGPISSLEVEWEVAHYSGLVRLISATLDEAAEEDDTGRGDRVKCSDISDREVLEIVKVINGPSEKWASHWWGPLYEFFLKYPPKLALAKMRQLYKRGLVDGCPCGCRGDWVLTDKGREFLETRN